MDMESFANVLKSMVHRHWRTGLFLTGLFFVGVWLFWLWRAGTSPALREYGEIEVHDHIYAVVISDRQSQIVQGLSLRKFIGADGMLFLFPQWQQPTFWMYKMRFPLDFVWIADNRIMQLDYNIPPPVSLSSPTTTIAVVKPAQPVQAVIELPAGFLKEAGWQVGDEVRIRPSRKWGIW